MSFAEEFARVTQRNAKPAAASPVAETQPQSDAPPQGDNVEAIMNSGLPDYKQTQADVVPELPVGGKPEPEPAKPTPKFRIAGKEFATQEEAFAYAEKLALDKIQDEAFNAGQKSALTPKEETQVRTLLDDINDELFVNPKSALEKLQKGIEDLFEKKFNEREDAKRVEQQRKEERDRIYKEFYTENPDIAEFPEIVEFVTQKFWNEVGPMPPKQGLARVAEETRKILKKSKEAMAPQREMQSKPATVAGGGSGLAPIASIESTVKDPVDFITQVNKHRKRA